MYGVLLSGVLTYLIFKRTETNHPLALISLLLVVPSALVLFPITQAKASSALREIASVFSVYWSTIIASTVAYRLSPWHPLARYPGPLLCKITKFRFAFLSLGGHQHFYLRHLHEKYGDIVRTGPNELSLRDANSIAGVLGNAGLPKSSFWDGRTPPGEVPIIGIKDRKEHGRRRRRWNRAFSPMALKGYEETVHNRVLTLCNKFTQLGQEKPIDISQYFSYFAYDVMNDLTFGGGSDMVTLGDTNGVWHLIDTAQRNAIFLSNVPWLGPLAYSLPFFNSQLKTFRAYGRARAIARHSDGSSRKDIFHYLTGEDGVHSQPPSMKEIISDGGLSIIAGSDTVASSSSHTIYFLMKNPSKLERLKQEIATLGNDLQDTSKLSQLPYLDAVLRESMRLMPPLLTGSQRKMPRDNDRQIVGSHYIPHDTSVSMAVYSMHHDPRYFSPLPDDFIPERWLPEDLRKELEPDIFDSGSNNFALEAGAFIPFSFGPQHCVGMNLAWMELRMLITTLVHKFDFSFDPNYDQGRWFEEALDYFVTARGELPVHIKVRKCRSGKKL